MSDSAKKPAKKQSNQDKSADQVSDWRFMHLWQFQPVRDVLVVLAVFGLFMLGYELRAVTVPMLIALLLAYLVEPIVGWMTRRFEWVSRPVAAGTLIVVLGVAVILPTTVGLVFGIGQAVESVDRFAVNITELQQSIDTPDDDAMRDGLPNEGWRRVRDYLVGLEATPDETGGSSAPSGDGEQPGSGDSRGSAEDAGGEASATSEGAAEGITLRTSQRLGRRMLDMVSSWFSNNKDEIGTELGQGALQVGAWAVRSIVSLVGTMFSLGFGAFLVMFFFFFFSTGLGGVKRFFETLVPKQHRKRVFSLAGQMDAVIAAFVRGRLTIMAIMSVEFVIAYWLIGVPAPLLLGLGVGILSAVPYLSLIGVPISIVLMLLEPSGAEWQTTWWWIVFAPIGVYMLVQATDDYLWTPMIQGKATDMDTPTILFAVLAGGVLFGIYGVLIAIPVAACLKILIREIVWPKFKEWVDGRANDPLPLDR